MDKSVISVVLLPNEQDSRQLTDLSDEISKSTDSLIRLGIGSLPHITLVQFAAPAKEAKNLWDEIQNLNSEVTSLVSAGLSFVPDSRPDLLWAELTFLKSEALKELQQQILDTTFAKNFSQNRGIADEYRPHCTLALLKNKIIPQLNIESFQVFKRSFEGLTLAVGANGENLTFTEAQYS